MDRWTNGPREPIRRNMRQLVSRNARSSEHEVSVDQSDLKDPNPNIGDSGVAHQPVGDFMRRSAAMSKATVKKLHWRSKVQESFVPLSAGVSSGELGLAIGGGADYGEFPFVTAAPGGGATVGDIILEIGGTPVLGMTLGDVRGVLNSCPHPIRIKTVSPGEMIMF
ncbi:hypothetical protein CHARACLAT_032507, partial [Characodon lateralis]|nr:hypothetical protein [Characodon lateralis]